MSLSKNILRIDNEIYQIAKRIKVLNHVNPVNSTSERKAFYRYYRRGEKYLPKFKYRPLRADIKDLTGNLKSLHSRLGRSRLDELYKTKIDELNTQIHLIKSVGNRERFFGYSMRLYGTPLDTHGGGVKPLDVANIWLSADRTNEERYLSAKGPKHNKESVAASLEREARFYGFKCKILVKDHLSSNAAAGESSVSLRSGILYSKKEAQRMCVHEVGFHVLTTYNGKRHRLRIFEIGTPGYLTDQEGGAIWAEEESKVMTNYRLAILGARTLGIYLAISGADFFEVFSIMHEKHGFSKDDAFYICERVFRGGLFTKDAIYQLGFYNVKNSFRFKLYNPYTFINGKMSLAYIPLVEELMKDGYMEGPRFIPRFLQDKAWISTWQTLSQTHNLFERKKFAKEMKK